MAKATDEKTLALIKEVQRRKEEIKKLEGRWTPNTNLSFSFVEGSASGVINLRTVTSLPTLISIVSFLMDRQNSYNTAAQILGVDDAPDFKWCGFTVKEWTEDVKTRVGKVQLDQKKRQLEALESRLEKIVSPELRAEMELQAIEELLK